MKIKVEVKNKLLGDSVFWEGDEKDINKIGNLPAREMAKALVTPGLLYGVTQKSGMWRVSEVKDEIPDK